MKRPHLLALALLSSLPLSAYGHALWIEELPASAGLGVRFAQWGDEYETSPGNLDSFIQVTGWTLNEKAEPQVLEVSKQKDHFFLGKLDLTRPSFAQAQFTVRQLHADKPARAPIFYCRWQPDAWTEGKPSMTMDVVPTGEFGKARVYFRGKPLGGVELLFSSPKVTDEKVTADAEGFIKAPDMSKPGNYLLAVARYSEELPGYFNGVPYGVTSHSASLYWYIRAAK